MEKQLFLTVSYSIPVETVKEDEAQHVHESTGAEEDEESQESLEEASIDWKPTEKISEFRKTYQDEEGQQIKARKELWINDPLKIECVSLATFHEMFPLRNKYPY